MTQTSTNAVGNSFKLGYRFQSYWGASMARAFFAAEVGTGTFLVSLYFDYLVGMILGLALAGTLKPYFHLSHMGVPAKAWRAMLRPDRSWVSRGGISVVLLVGFGVLHILNRSVGLDKLFGVGPQVGEFVKYIAIAAGLVVISYQGMAMSASESFTLWASPLVPAASFCYALTAGALSLLAIGWGELGAEPQSALVRFLETMLLLDLVIVVGLLVHARSKSKGGAFSVNLLMRGELSGQFRLVAVLLGLIVPVALVAYGSAQRPFVAAALIAFLVGFYTLRNLLFKAAVYEPITHDLAGSIGLARSR